MEIANVDPSVADFAEEWASKMIDPSVITDLDKQELADAIQRACDDWSSDIDDRTVDDAV